jgi:hypothetical protein
MSITFQWTYETPSTHASNYSQVCVRAEKNCFYSTLKIGKDSSHPERTKVAPKKPLIKDSKTQFVFTPVTFESGVKGISKPKKFIPERTVRTKITIAELLN